MKKMFKIKIVVILCIICIYNIIGINVEASEVIEISAPSVILIEATTGKVIYEKNATEERSPASITKIMTILLAFEHIAEHKMDLTDEVITSAHAASMGGSQVFLAEKEVQTVETMLKCIIVSSANDASVAIAEHIAGSELAFIDMMNAKAKELGMLNTNFEDCCGLTNSDNHYTSANDVAIMSQELINKYPEIFQYTRIWMEDITHQTKNGSSTFTLTNTNKLIKQYEWATGLKTGSTNKAKYCLSATAEKNGISLIAVVLGAPDYLVRFDDATTLLNYGFSVSSIYIDENKDILPNLEVKGAIVENVPLIYQNEFRYLDIEGTDLDIIEKKISIPEYAQAPILKGQVAGKAIYMIEGKEIGSVPIYYGKDIEEASYKDFIVKSFFYFLL